MPAEQDSLSRSLADEMALLLSSGDGTIALAVMQRLRLLTAPEASGGGAPVRSKNIGIWEASPQGYERSEARRHDWARWANLQLIPPKGERKRVLLLGESVARGYFYDPEFTPAQALESSLETALGEPIEIIDLAKVGLLAPELVSLSNAALALEPDALVFFAGNNWFVSNERDRCLNATALRERGVLGLKELCEQRLSTWVKNTIRQHVTKLSARQPLVLVIPEFNLAGWRLDAEADAPWLPLGRNRRWLECRAAARSALAAGCLDEAQNLALEMVELDGGTAASGWTILADCARIREDFAAARTYLEKGRDSHIWNNTPQTPRALSVSQHALRESALPGRIGIADLPRCFASWQRGELPDSRLFLDYCHLTAEGICVAMAKVASELAVLLDVGRPLPDLESLVAAAPVPSARLDAEAHFAAAIHCAHWGQQTPAVAFRCHEAVRRSPEVAQVMREYLEIQTRQAPTWTCAATERFFALASPALRRYVGYSQAKLFDPVLLPAIADALEQSGLPSVAFLDEIRRDERSLTERPRDLLDPYNRTSWADRDWLGWPTRFCRVYSPKSRYPWVSRTPREVLFELTCRGRHTPPSAECHLWINGVHLAPCPLNLEWTTFRFSAPANLVQTGVNWLEIHWPLELSGGEEEIERIARDHEHGRHVPFLPVFAEVFSLSAVQR